MRGLLRKLCIPAGVLGMMVWSMPVLAQGGAWGGGGGGVGWGAGAELEPAGPEPEQGA